VILTYAYPLQLGFDEIWNLKLDCSEKVIKNIMHTFHDYPACKEFVVCNAPRALAGGVFAKKSARRLKAWFVNLPKSTPPRLYYGILGQHDPKNWTVHKIARGVGEWLLAPLRTARVCACVLAPSVCPFFLQFLIKLFSVSQGLPKNFFAAWKHPQPLI